MGWQNLNLTRKDGHPEPGQLCVIARVWAGSAGGPEQQYLVGCFVRDPRAPKSTKLWWQPGTGGSENPASWSSRYRDIQWCAISPPEKKVR